MTKIEGKQDKDDTYLELAEDRERSADGNKMIVLVETGIDLAFVDETVVVLEYRRDEFIYWMNQ